MEHDIHSAAYTEMYAASHKQAGSQQYRMSYWNHSFLDSLLNKDKQAPTHLLEEGGGTCGIWNSLSFDQYTSVDISEPMTFAARKLFNGQPGKEFILGDIFSKSLTPKTYSAIIANAYGVYYRPDMQHLQRFYDFLAPGGMLFLAIDPAVKMRHSLAAPFAALIDKRIRRYTRFSTRIFRKMARQTGFGIWLEMDYEPAPGWQRRAFILTKAG